MMMKETIITADRIGDDAEMVVKTELERRIARWTLFSYVTFSCGILAAIGGIVLGAESYVGMLTDVGTVNSIANFLIILAFPLMMVGAHALDKLSELKSPAKDKP